MAATLPDWPRQYFTGAGGKPFLYYVVYGNFKDLPALSASQYRSPGIPAGFDLMRYDRQQSADVVSQFRDGYLWDELVGEHPELASQIVNAEECLILRGEQEDGDKLNYLRDCVGLLTFLLDHGGVAVYDPQMFKWWLADEWRQLVFEPAGPVPRQHVVILVSEESKPGLSWFHTRGLRKFGRPDLSIHNVSAEYRGTVIDLCNRFIELQAFGGIIPEGQEIRMKDLPTVMRCHHGGELEDPDFNNVHVEIRWPESFHAGA
ncbi:MAG TPA: hypothetical protein VG826_01670 [Pirellulales bacterium]|nr:hypothetical protein [Pirellulales bacterium]